MPEKPELDHNGVAQRLPAIGIALRLHQVRASLPAISVRIPSPRSSTGISAPATRSASLGALPSDRGFASTAAEGEFTFPEAETE